MNFTSAQDRRLWSVIVYTLIFDIAVVFGIASLIGVDSDFWLVVFFGVLALWTVQVLIRLKNAAFSHLYFVVSDKQRRVEAVIDQLLKCKIPKYNDDYLPSPVHYFDEVLKETNASNKALGFAGMALGAIGVLRNQFLLVPAYQWNVVMEEALRRYGTMSGGGETKSTPEEDLSEFTQGEVNAYQQGKDMAATVADALDQFIKLRFGDLNNNFLNILSDSLTGAAQQEEHSPLLFARALYANHNEEIGDLKPQILAEVEEHMADWREVYEQMEMVDALDELINNRVDALTQEMTFSAFQLFIDKAEEIKEADDQWRSNYPDKAAEQPLESDGDD